MDFPTGSIWLYQGNAEEVTALLREYLRNGAFFLDCIGFREGRRGGYYAGLKVRSVSLLQEDIRLPSATFPTIEIRFENNLGVSVPVQVRTAQESLEVYSGDVITYTVQFHHHAEYGVMGVTITAYAGNRRDSIHTRQFKFTPSVGLLD